MTGHTRQYIYGGGNMLNVQRVFAAFVLMAGVACIWGIPACYATDGPIYSNRFEEGTGFSFWCTSGNIWSLSKAQEEGYIKVNYAGLSDEEHFDGKKSYKLDITLNKGQYCLFRLPLGHGMPLTDLLNLSCCMRVKKPAGGVNVGFGWSVMVPNGKQMGNNIPFIQQCPNGWVLASGNIFNAVKGICSANENTYGKLGDGSGFKVDALTINLQSRSKEGFSGQNIVLYADSAVLGKDKSQADLTGLVDNCENGLIGWTPGSWAKDRLSPVISLADANASEGKFAVVMSFPGDKTVVRKAWPMVKDWQNINLSIKKISGLGQCQVYLVEDSNGKEEWFHGPVLPLGPVWQKVNINYSDFKYGWGPADGDKKLDKSKIIYLVFLPITGSTDIEFAIDNIKVE
jgi:hypothetical protein